jgi:ketosteroid isomerase-like protein
MTMSAATEIAKRIEHAFNTSDMDALGACYAEQAVQQHPVNPAGNHGRAAIIGFETGMFAAFSDIDFHVERVIDGGEWATVEAVVQATHTDALAMPDGTEVPATNVRIALPVASIVRLDGDGLVAEEHRYLDVAGMMGQLGLMG